MPRLAASKPRRERKLFLSLSSLAVSQLYIFNELASFLSVLYLPTPPLLHSITSPPCPLSLFLVSLFLLHPMFFLLAFTMLQKGPRKSTMLCYQEIFSTIVLQTLCANIHCPKFHAKGMRYARGENCTVEEVTME